MEIRKTGTTFAYTTGLALYGKAENGNYTIEVGIPGYFYRKLYSSKKRPWIRNINLISILWLPFASIFMLGVLAFGIFYVTFLDFFLICLFDKRSISGKQETTSGLISFMFYVFGVIVFFMYIFGYIVIQT